MKHLYKCLFLLLLIFSCSNENQLTFKPLIVEEDTCSNCPNISIHIPQAIGETELAKTINIALKEELISLLLFDEEVPVETIDDAIISFKNGYTEMQKLYTDESTAWEAQIEGVISYEDEQLLTIALSSYLFTGGAHGYNSQRFLNFDKKKALELENSQLFLNESDFQDFAESAFREKEHIPKDKSINFTGFMFETEHFHLPENIGFTEQGLKLLYNPYEVASYADGPVELLLPYLEVQEYLSVKPKS